MVNGMHPTRSCRDGRRFEPAPVKRSRCFTRSMHEPAIHLAHSLYIMCAPRGNASATQLYHSPGLPLCSSYVSTSWDPDAAEHDNAVAEPADRDPGTCRIVMDTRVPLTMASPGAKPMSAALTQPTSGITSSYTWCTACSQCMYAGPVNAMASPGSSATQKDSTSCGAAASNWPHAGGDTTAGAGRSSMLCPRLFVK